jgi:hypothetical protein
MRRDRALLDRLSTEAALLLLSAGPPRNDPEVAELLRTRSVDWPALLAVADRERATAIVWRRIREHLPAGVPPEVRAAFERMALVADFTASYLSQRLEETLVALNARGIRGLLLKGAALAVTDYRSFADRPMSDVDLVVRREEADEAFTAAQGVGWRWDSASYPRERYTGHHHLPPLLDARGMDGRLELHTSLFVEGGPFSLEADLVVRDGREVRVGKGVAIVPSREHLLIHTCLHYTWSHQMVFGAWRAFRDVIAMSQAGLDWGHFVEEAERHRAASSCYWTLRLAERLAGAEIPPAVLVRLGRATTRGWKSLLDRHAAREMFPSADRCPSQWLRRVLWARAIRPVESGHGAARPWLLDDMAPENLDPTHREVAAVRALRQLPRMGAWLRYARALVG